VAESAYAAFDTKDEAVAWGEQARTDIASR
jgi:hypothetical protein